MIKSNCIQMFWENIKKFEERLTQMKILHQIIKKILKHLQNKNYF